MTNTEEPGPLAKEFARVHEYVSGEKLRTPSSRDEALAALSVIRRHVQDMETALDAGRRFERFYQEMQGAVWTLPRHELLESLQSAFIDAYAALPAREKGTE